MGGGRTLEANSFGMHQGGLEAPSLCEDSQAQSWCEAARRLALRDHVDLHNEVSVVTVLSRQKNVYSFKDFHVPVPRTCNYVPLHGKRDFYKQE